jgi:hypothetical protein
VVERLMKMKGYWNRILQSNKRILTELDKDFFWEELRPMFVGFSDLIFEGVENGQNKVLSSTGGTGGHDPSFQIFERGMGLVY